VFYVGPVGQVAGASGSQAPPPPSVVLVVPSAETASAVRVTRFSSSRKRITNRGKNRTATVIKFRLSQPARLVLVFRGPGPDCDVAARKAVLGLAGVNRIRFDGTIRKRRLEPGTYLLVTRLKNDSEPLARTYLTIVDPSAPFAPRVLPRCSQPAPSFVLAFPHPQLTALGGTFTGQATPTPSASPEAEEADDGSGTVLPTQTPEGTALPEVPPVASGNAAPGALGIALLVLLFGSLVAIIIAVVANLRSQEPRF
jgi:hypothetical protein